MNYTDEQKKQTERAFNSFCKTVIRYCAINLYREHSRAIKRYISLDEIYAEYQDGCGECDTYLVLQYHFEAFGNIFSIHDDRLGKALSKLPKKKRDVILTYYFTGCTLKSIAEKIGKPRTNISYIHVRILKKLRELMEDGNEREV